VTKKWKNLRTHFGDEKKKMMALKSGMGAEDAYESKWRWFGMMKFMDKHVSMKPKTTLSNLKIQVCCYMLFSKDCYVMLFCNVCMLFMCII